MSEDDNSEVNNQPMTPDTAMLNRVTIKPPPFWKGDPAIWFA